MIYSLPGNLHVLLIDGQGDLESLHAVFQVQGIRTVLVPDSERAYARAIALQPDVILFALSEETANGMAILQMFKANSKTSCIPVLILSKINKADVRVEAFRYGAVDYVIMPAREEELYARIAIHLGLKNDHILLEEIKLETLEPEAEEQDDNEVLVNAARMYIRNHLQEIPNTRSIAHQLNVSDRRLVDAFRICLRMTPFEYLRGERMRRAEVLLRTTPLQLHALAAEVGYSSAANFVTAFREFYGMPPVQYRREKMAPRKH